MSPDALMHESRSCAPAPQHARLRRPQLLDLQVRSAAPFFTGALSVQRQQAHLAGVDGKAERRHHQDRQLLAVLAPCRFHPGPALGSAGLASAVVQPVPRSGHAGRHHRQGSAHRAFATQLTGSTKLFERDSAQGWFSSGHGYANFLQDISGLGLDAAFTSSGLLRAIRSRGWGVGYTRGWTSDLSSSASYGYLRVSPSADMQIDRGLPKSTKFASLNLA